MPSLKYSFSGSRLRFANASTAIDLAPTLGTSADSCFGANPARWRDPPSPSAPVSWPAREQLLADAVAEVFILRIAAEIRERKHGDRFSTDLGDERRFLRSR